MKKLFSDRTTCGLSLLTLLPLVAAGLVPFCIANTVIRMVFWIGCGLAFLLKGSVLFLRLNRRADGSGVMLRAVVFMAFAFLADLLIMICSFYIKLPLWFSIGFLLLAVCDLIVWVILFRRLLRGGEAPLTTLAYGAGIFLLILVFLVCLGVGFAGSDYTLRTESGDEAEINDEFTLSDHQKVLAEIKEDYDEEIYYKISPLSERITSEGGFSYYTITYYVCTASSERVDTYLYYKFATDSPDYSAGDVICMLQGTSMELSRSDVFPDGLE